ncbi:BTB/POZ domain [Nesidiocoris tenuis]|uniref:Regulatory protein zeste n=1 Tax=Nesidiocoris tenuis TaxID=355587 RepID=A0ABN7AUD4_9HEMI|nr:BTB/POZ domain [Nesidiocoris tenuis]
MECVPDLAFLQMAAASNSEMFNKMMWQTTAAGAGAAATATTGTMKQRKTNFTSREVESLLKAVADRKNTVLFGVAGGIGWARAWHEVARAVSAVEGIHRSESDVRKKWTYLKWEAKNTSKPGRDPTSRAVLDILMSKDAAAAAAAAGNSLLEQLLVPGSSPGSPAAVPVKKSSVAGRVSPQLKETSPQVAGSHSAPSPTPSSGGSVSGSGAPEVCLRWNSYHSNMQAVFPSLLNNEQFVDVTLACEGRSIKCHKVMLSACSSYLEELLSQNPCQHPIVFMRDLKFWELQALVEFMYSGEVNVTQDKLPSLLAAADALQIKGLAGPSAGSSVGLGDEDVTQGATDCDDTAAQFTLNRRSRKRKSTNPLPYIHHMQTPPISLKHPYSSHQPSKSSHHSSPPPLAQLPPRHQSPVPQVGQPLSMRMSPPPGAHGTRTTPTPPVSSHTAKSFGVSPRRPGSPQMSLTSQMAPSRAESPSPGGLSHPTGHTGPPNPYRPSTEPDDQQPLALCTHNEPLNLGIDSKEHGSGKSSPIERSSSGPQGFVQEENGMPLIKHEHEDDDDDGENEDQDPDQDDELETGTYE